MECWWQLSQLWDSDPWKAKNAQGRANRLIAGGGTHHQGSTTVSGYAEIYVSVIFFTSYLCMLSYGQNKICMLF